MNGLVGLVPAAGRAKRLSPLPSSKELFPIGYMAVELEGKVEWRPKPVGMYLLERMAAAGVDRILMILSKEKTDLLRYFGSCVMGIPLAYLLQENLWGMPYALDLARPWVRNDTVLFGMPDTIFTPENAFPRLLEAHHQTGADLTLGLFPTTKPERFGMVAFDDRYQMQYTVDKPTQTDLRYMWGIGCWGPTFTRFMAEHLQALVPEQEIVLADIFQAALDVGLNVRVLPFEGSEYIDMGTLEDLMSVIRRFSQPSG